MKKIHLIIILAGVMSVFSAWAIRKNIQNKKIAGLSVRTPSSTIMPENTVEINFKGKSYWASWISIFDTDRLVLYPNFEAKDTSLTFIKKNNCKSLISGGFYTEDDKPLGLFIAEGEKLRDKIKSSLATGIFSLAYNGAVDISSDSVDEKPRFAIQTGPILIENGIFRKLYSRDDTAARRVVVSLTEKNEVVFIAFYSSSSPLQGPYLADLPPFLSRFQDKTGIHLAKAVNLDGGSASAFYNGSFLLEEINYVGSYFCIR